LSWISKLNLILVDQQHSPDNKWILYSSQLYI
jgi:hypothetical protein